MVFLADVREVDVADLVLMVEGDEQPPVADRDVTWHELDSFVVVKIFQPAQTPAALLISYRLDWGIAQSREQGPINRRKKNRR